MTIKVKGKVGEINLRATELFLPLFEVVVNAIQAIHEKKLNNGLIKIQILRDKSQTAITNEDFEEPYFPISGYIVSDNGIGFNNDNFTSFDEAYSGRKLHKGGKGVGRFTVLAAFENMKVKSSFYNNGHFEEREFDFNVNDEIKQIVEPTKSEKEYSGTKVELQKYLPPFIEKTRVSKEKIAEKISDHCLIYFITETMPRVLISDEQDNKTIDLADIYKNYIKSDMQQFLIEDEKFKLYFLKKYTSKGQHKISYCANDRVVEEKKISTLIPNLEKIIQENNKEYFLSLYITGKYFDNNTIEIRNQFTFPEKTNDKDSFHKLSLEEISNEITNLIAEKYKDLLDEIDKEKISKINNYIFSGKGIEYRHLLGNNQNFAHISPDISEDKLESELHKINYKLEKEHRKRTKKILDKKRIRDYDEYSDELRKILINEQDFSKSKLADYVIRRKVVLKVLEKFLEWDEKRKYRLEEDLHNIIYPMGGDSDTIPYNEHNLWLLDEKLTFHTYVASDKKFKKIKTIQSESGKEPDLAIFDYPFAYSTDKFSSLTIFEFKRPGREFSGNDRNLDKQVINYFQILTDSKAKNYKGTKLHIQKTTPKFGYIVIDDLDDGLVDHLRGFGGNYGLTPTGTLYKYFDSINLYIEIMTYHQILENAKKQHKAFFKQLGIDNL